MTFGWRICTGKAEGMAEAATDNRHYTADRPSDCIYCYFWNGRTKSCREQKCYYLADDGQEKNGQAGRCTGCPYGKHSPCIGYCLLRLIREMGLWS